MSETEKTETATEKPETETVKPETETVKPETETPRDWVGEAVKCFIRDAEGIDPANPVRAVEVYFKKNATDELKARCKAEGKDAKSCWKFIEAVARQALNGHNGHIDPSAIYAIAMHYFEDVPKDWENLPKPKPAAKPASTPKKNGKPKKPAETPSEIKKEKERAKKAAAKKAAAKKKAAPKVSQGFFFNLLETPGTEQESEVKE